MGRGAAHNFTTRPAELQVTPDQPWQGLVLKSQPFKPIPLKLANDCASSFSAATAQHQNSPSSAPARPEWGGTFFQHRSSGADGKPRCSSGATAADCCGGRATTVSGGGAVPCIRAHHLLSSALGPAQPMRQLRPRRQVQRCRPAGQHRWPQLHRGVRKLGLCREACSVSKFSHGCPNPQLPRLFHLFLLEGVQLMLRGRAAGSKPLRGSCASELS